MNIIGTPLFQWETGRQLQIIPLQNMTVSAVHFSNPGDLEALVIKPKEVDGKIVADIPNILLQKGSNIVAYSVNVSSDCVETLHECIFPVRKRAKPSDYVYTETEILNYSRLSKRIDDMEGEGLAKAVEDYLAEHPVDSITDEELAEAVEAYMAEHPIEVPDSGGNVDLTGYATEEWVKDQKYLTEVPEGYAKTEDIPTDEHIIDLIEENIPESPDGGIAVAGATVGQTVKISEVDENGVPTAWEAVDFPGEEKYELIETIVCDGTFGNISRLNLSLEKAKVFLHMKAASAAATVCIEAYNDAGLFGYAWLGNCINTGERFATAWFVSDGMNAYAEFTSPGSTKYNTGGVNRTLYPLNADTPINRLGIYTSPNSNVFPAESTIEIWGVRA